MADKKRTDNDEIDLISLAKYLRRYVVWIVLAGIIGAGVVGFCTKTFAKPKYQATTTMYVYSENKTGGIISNNEILMAQNLVGTYRQILTSETILDLVIKNLGDPDLTTDQLRKMISAEIVEDTQVLLVKVTADTPEKARDITNAIAQEAPAEIVRITKAGGVEIVDYAKLPQTEINNNLKRNILIGFCFGCAVLIGILLIRKMTNRKINTESDIASLFDLPVLGTVPTQEGNSEKSNTNWSMAEEGMLSYEEKRQVEKTNEKH